MYEVIVAADLNTLAARVRQAIVASGMSQQALAERIGMDPTALSKILTGKRQAQLAGARPDCRRDRCPRG